MACSSYSLILGNPNPAILSPPSSSSITFSPKTSSLSSFISIPSISFRFDHSATPLHSRIHHRHRHRHRPSDSMRERERKRRRRRRELRERKLSSLITTTMACSSYSPILGNPNSAILSPPPSSSITLSPKFSSLSFNSSPSITFRFDHSATRLHSRIHHRHSNFVVMASTVNSKPLRIMISGAPASGKGTQCELITGKYGLVHIAAGDLLRAEITSGSENGKQAKEYMDKGQLVPDEIVVMMVKDRLMQPDSQEKGWLLDGYPRSLSQAIALKEFGFQPDLFILLEVPEELLVERVVGRRLDPDTGKIYHMKYSPPENDEVASRLTQRFDDTEEKVKLRLQTHHQNVEAVLSMYEDIIVRVDGGAKKEDVFAQIDKALSKLVDQKTASESVAA